MNNIPQCSNYNKHIDDAVAVGVSIQLAIYTPFLVFNILSINNIIKQKNISNKSFIKYSYLCIFFTIFLRILTGIFYFLWQKYSLNKKNNLHSNTEAMTLQDQSVIAIFHHTCNILALPFLLLLVSITTHEWFIQLAEYEHKIFVDLGQPDTKVRLTQKLKRIKIFFIIINILFFVTNILYMLISNQDYTHLIISSEFLFLSIVLATIGYQLYYKSGRKQWFLKHILIIQILLLGRSIDKIVQEVYYRKLKKPPQTIKCCIDHSCTNYQFLRSLEDQIFCAGVTPYNQNYHTTALVVYYLYYYICFEFIPCIFFQLIVKPKQETLLNHNISCQQIPPDYLFDSK